MIVESITIKKVNEVCWDDVIVCYKTINALNPYTMKTEVCTQVPKGEQMDIFVPNDTDCFDKDDLEDLVRDMKGIYCRYYLYNEKFDLIGIAVLRDEVEPITPTTYYNGMSLSQKVNFFNRTIAENNHADKFSYFMELGDDNFQKVLDYLGYEQFTKVLTDSVASETLNVDNDTYFIYDSDAEVFYGVDVYGGIDDTRKFDEIFESGIIDELTNNADYAHLWES